MTPLITGPLVFAVLDLFVCISQVSGILCYNCSNVHDPRCGDPFWDRSLSLVNCPSASATCRKVKWSGEYTQALERSCSDDEVAIAGIKEYGKTKNCVTQFIPFKGEVTQCHCITKGCNSVYSCHQSNTWRTVFSALLIGVLK
ncbi:uncharacterized protein LOC125663739 [Ostrea edulis]|uniref:uncharacterized protein LOC125663739 n=1 Tax=Ostrea edulis TaxID=37623 RepID=UPI0024AFAD9D|nr:uncharacterized protein LOC125663739 [Ostrea edulis]